MSKSRGSAVSPSAGANFCFLCFSIDNDILNLMDEVNVDEFLMEASNAIDDPDKLSQYIREKTIIAIERFLVSALARSWIYVKILFHLRLTCLLNRITYQRCQSQSRNVNLVTVGFFLAMDMMEEA
jgi:hypothetical protein